jgi:hypothetical protein
MEAQEAIKHLWKCMADYGPGDLYATLVKDTEMREWNGVHPVEENTTVREAPAGTTVIVVMISRFGDVGVRDKKLEPSYGYYARGLNPETDLTNWRKTP